jgi:hypothetical protein
MRGKLTIFCVLLLFIAPLRLSPQAKPAFSGEPGRYREELLAYMGTTLNEEQTANVNAFIAKWDSAAYSKVTMFQILDLSSQMASKQMRAIPHFNEFLKTLNEFVDYKRDGDFLTYWLTGLSEMLFNPRLTNENLATYFRNTSLLIRENVLFNSGSVKWKVKTSDIKFVHDTIFKIVISNATLTCYSQRDSTEIYNASGSYIPDIQQFHGKYGIVTWEKAGYLRENVFAELRNYRINASKSGFTSDSAKLTNKTYFKEPVYGILSDQAVSIMAKEKVTFPRFETYVKEFRIDNIYEGVDYEGGLVFEGASVKGNGELFNPARISLSRNDTLFMKLASNEFTFTINTLTSPEAESALYLGGDSIYHSNLGFSYNVSDRQVSLLRTNNPISKSPYFNSYHSLDMYFESLLWDMKGSKVILSRARGASIGQARFESVSSFNAKYFLQLMGLDEYHPLNRLKQFSEWYYSETFPVVEFARWLNKPEEAVTGLCIDLANRGFIFYDRANKEVTIKKKVNDFIDFFVGRKDYDVLSVISETKAPVDNAILDLNDFRLKVNGVRGVFLSDSQNVMIYPYQQRLSIGKNRNLEFDGIVEAGLFTIYGHDFVFNYDTFKITLNNIDSIKVAVETDRRDPYGNPVFDRVDNMIQLAKAEVYIDDPLNKSGLKSLDQYPIINAVSESYIFFDKIPGLEGIYGRDDFYFRVDPFTYENIDHYKLEDMNLSGVFYGGNIIKPVSQYLVIHENKSLGFNMTIPEEGIDIYGEKGRLYDFLSMSNHGLTGHGTLKHLSSTTISDDYRFYPDSMTTTAKVFNMENDGSGLFPDLASQDVKIMWMPEKDEWHAINSRGKSFNMFENGTSLDGSLTLTPKVVNGSGIINMPDSRISSNLFRFTSSTIHADTADYNLKSPSTSGDAFIAENAATDINFNQSIASFQLNTGSSMVKFPEIEYICTMTDFVYNMSTGILDMEQKGKRSMELLTPSQLLRVSLSNLEKPTFFSTNTIRDTITFLSGKARYYVKEEYIEAEEINYLKIADALIQPGKGRMIIDRRARIRELQDAILAVNNRHILHSGKINIESTRKYSGSALYDYMGENKEIQRIIFPELSVDTLTTTARGYIPVNQNFMLNPAFTFSGDVFLSARANLLTFTGAAGILHDCNRLISHSVKFRADIDPMNVMIPVSEKPRDINDNLVYSGSFINTDSAHIYPAFLSYQKAWSDVGLINSNGFLWYDKSKNRYVIASREKIADPAIHGSLVAFDKNFCVISGEGPLAFGANFDLMKMNSAGRVIQTLDSGKVTINAILALDFHFSPEALALMSEEIRMIPSLRTVNLKSDLIDKGMKDLIGVSAANRLKEELDLFGTSRNIPKEFTYELLLNDVTLNWNEFTSSFRSEGKIGIGFIGAQPVNLYVDGYVEIQRRRSGDMIDVYLKADQSSWYYFSYFRGVMMAQAGNSNFNRIISSARAKERRDPSSTARLVYSYMIAVEDRLGRFLRRMESNEGDRETSPFDGLFK